MNETLKAAGHIGAELARAKMRIVRLRGLLLLATDRWESWASEIIHTTPEYESELAEIAKVRAALSQQAEPAEPAPAQDEREAFEAVFSRFDLRPSIRVGHYSDLRVQFMWEAWQARATRPAQNEQQLITHRPLIRNAISLLGMRRPVAPDVQTVIDDLESMLQGMPTPTAPAEAQWLEVAELAAPIAQTEQQPEQINIDPLLNAGAALSNIAYNLAQRPGVTLDKHVCDLLSSSRKHWDEARAALKGDRE